MNKFQYTYYVVLGLWPRGDFAIPRTAFGCPDNDLLKWHIGRLTIRSEQVRSHAMSSSYSQAGRLEPKLVTVEVCSKLESELSVRDQGQQMGWPKGRYCVYAIKQQCPGGKHFFVHMISTNAANSKYLGMFTVNNRELLKRIPLMGG